MEHDLQLPNAIVNTMDAPFNSDLRILKAWETEVKERSLKSTALCVYHYFNVNPQMTLMV